MSEPLNIHDRSFLIQRLIEQAPKTTMVREFFKNAEENAALTPGGDGKVRIYPVIIEGVRKLAFWNTGIGMSDTELRTATEISASINKAMGLDGNYGIGAKVSGLAVSPHGIRYRSCKEGNVHEVTIGYDETLRQYVRFSTQFDDGTTDTVVDVTEIVRDEGSRVDFDWTEVVLLGEAADHDTVLQPLKQGDDLERSYIPSEIFRRFSSFNESVKLNVDVAMTKGGGKGETGKNRQVKPLSAVLENLHAETIRSEEHGISVRYISDPRHPGSSHSTSSRLVPAVASTAFCALVHKGERYDYKTKSSWSAAAPNFGVPFGSKVLSIEVMLDDVCASPNQYRDGLTYPEDRSAMHVSDYSTLVRDLMPDWFKEIIQQQSPKFQENLDDLRADLQKLLDEFKVPTPALRNVSTKDAVPFEVDNQGETSSKPDTSDLSEFPGQLPEGDNARREERNSGQRASDTKVRKAPLGAKSSKTLQALENVPKIIMLHDPAQIEEKSIKGRAACYYKETQEIFVNCLYPAADRMVSELEVLLAGTADADVLREVITNASRRSMAYRVGKGVCFAISKRLLDEWNSDDLDRATSPEALSMMADDFRQAIQETKRYVQHLIKVKEAENITSPMRELETVE